MILVDTPVDAQGIAVEDIWIVSLGDSFASGEGNPNMVPSPWSDDVAAAGSEILDGSGILHGKWLDDEKCHRSRWGWPYLVAEKAADRYTRPVHFSFLACSGAKLKEGLLEPFTDGGVHRTPQLDRLARLIEAAGRPPNAVLLSGGGNDVGFAKIVEECVTPGDCPGGDATAALPRRIENLEGEDGLYHQVATRLSEMGAEGVPSNRILLLVYPNPLVGKKRLVFRRGWGSKRVLAACHLLAGPQMWSWASNNVVEPLKRIQRQEASEQGWLLIDGHHPTFLKHSYCPRHGLPGADSWWVGLVVTGARQLSIHGTFHPNRRGHANLAGWALDKALPALETPLDPDPAPEVIRLALEEVAGDWVRVGGNNPRNDGMRIRVEGSRATVTAMPPSGSNRFGVGMVLWENIRDDGTVQVQGSDRRLYDAELTMEGENRLQIDVDHFGPGYEQTWERAGPAIDGDWVLVAADEDGSAGTRIRVEGDRATLLYVPPAAPRGYRTGGVLWQEIGAGDRRGLGRLEALSGGRSYTPAQYRLQAADRLRLVRDADGSVELWARPGVAEELLAEGGGREAWAAAELDPEVPGDPTERAETLRRLNEGPTLDPFEPPPLPRAEATYRLSVRLTEDAATRLGKGDITLGEVFEAPDMISSEVEGEGPVQLVLFVATIRAGGIASLWWSEAYVASPGLDRAPFDEFLPDDASAAKHLPAGARFVAGQWSIPSDELLPRERLAEIGSRELEWTEPRPEAVPEGIRRFVEDELEDPGPAFPMMSDMTVLYVAVVPADPSVASTSRSRPAAFFGSIAR